MKSFNIVYSNMQTMNTAEASLIPRNHFADSRNMVRRKDGLWENRRGIQQFGETIGLDKVHSIFAWKTETNVRYLTLGVGDDIYAYTEGSEYNNGTYAVVQALASSQPWDATVYRDILVLGNGVDDIYTTTDNATFTARSGTNVFKSRLFEVGNDFVSQSGVIAEPNKFFLSGAAPAQPWVTDPNSTLNVDIGNNENVTCIKSLGASIIVTKPSKTYLVDLAGLTRTTLDWAGGTESSRGMVQTQLNTVLVAGRQGIYSIGKTQIGSNTYQGRPENAPVSSLYDTCVDYSSINTLYTPDLNYAIFGFQSSALGDIALIKNMDFDEAVWTYFTGVNSADWTIYRDSDNNNHILYADNATGKVWELLKDRNDNGAPILSNLRFKNDDLDVPGQYKYISHIDLTGFISENAEWEVEIFKDDEALPFRTAKITKEQWQNNNVVITGLGSHALGLSPLGGEFSSSDDIEVQAFNARINIQESLEKLQVLLYNNQRDTRVVFRAMVIYGEVLPKDHYQNNNII